MPRLKDVEHKLQNDAFGYSGVGLDKLGAAEYTLVSIAQDSSGSVGSFRKEMEKCLKTVLGACKYSKRADNLLIRRVDFDSQMEEIHGFKPLTELKPDDYDGSIKEGGMTSLFDCTKNVVEATNDYAKKLHDQDFAVNAILFVISDGLDNNSASGMMDVKTSLTKAVQAEQLESIVTVLIGVNLTDPSVKSALENFSTTAGFTQFVDIGEATPEKLARLADFVSKSISAQSQALGSGGPSKQLTF